MQAKMCSRCGKNVAVVFITKLEGGVQKNEGLCLKCARELHIKPVDDMIEKMGISDEDLDNLSGEMMNALNGVESLMDMSIDPDNDANDDSDDDGKTATFPFLNRLFGNGNNTPAESNNAAAQQPPKEGGKPPKRKFLDNYCINLTDRARAGKLDNMVGREEELERVIQILNRRQKNNPCLIGEPGVGKTAVAEGLAQRIALDQVPYKLRGKEVYLLDLTALVAGTQFRGQFESRMKGLIEEIRKQGNIILVIDEVHNIVGAGDAEGSMNAANILKPALSRGEIQVIGATTFTEYRKHIEKDSALERRFQPVTINEPSVADSIEILKGIRRYYEDYHGVKISDEMCAEAVKMSERYITDRFLPDKAIDLIDEACSDVNLKDKNIIRRAELRKDLDDLKFERETLMSADAPKGEELTDEALDKRYERIAELRSKEMQREQELASLELEGVPELTIDNLARIIELWTKIPASSIRKDEFERLAELDKRLKAHIVGQDEAVNAVCAAIKRSRVGLKAKRKPTSFIFVGGTGVGKTELVKRLAADLFDSPESLIRLDMSEFMEKFSVSRIIGSPPGYVGYEDGGQLTERVRRKPWSVVLFDEIEKAHEDVWGILLQIMDDGRLTDSAGRVVSFRNTIIVMTSNVGAKSISDGRPRMGFTPDGGDEAQLMRARINEELRRTFKPEFLNRIDETIVFRRLSRAEIRSIAERMLLTVAERFKALGMTLSVPDQVVDFLAERGYDEKYGARPLRRAIRSMIEDKAAELMLTDSLGRGDTVQACIDGNELILTKHGV